MRILNDGIYFKQTDEKEDGYYTKDDDGNLIHHDYKKPTFWQRAKFFATYGYEMHLETIFTSYFYFLPDFNEIYKGSIVGDAVTTAKHFRKKRNFGSSNTYFIDYDAVKFETEHMFFQLVFSDDGMYVKVYRKRKSNNREMKPETYTYLDWNNI